MTQREEDCKTAEERMEDGCGGGGGSIKASDEEASKDGGAQLKKNMSLVFESLQGATLATGTKKDAKEEAFLGEGSAATKERFSPIWRQSFASFGSIIASVSAGMTSGFSATMLPQLKQPDSIIPIDQETESWIAAIAALPMFAGCIISGLMIERFGRRTTHMILAVPFVAGWALIATAAGLGQLLVGRFLTGLCVGVLGPAGSVYIGEISDPKYRGFLLSGISLAISTGLLVVHAVGTFLSWRTTAALSAVVPVVSFAVMACVPESPSYLAAKGRRDAAVASFKWFRGCARASLDELDALLARQAIAEAAGTGTVATAKTFEQKWKRLVETLRRPEFIKPLLIMIAFFFTAQFSGINAVAFYSVSIMQSTLGKGFDEYLAMLIIDGVRLVVSLAASVALRVLGRRPLAMFSGCFTVASLFGLAAFKHFAAADSWLPLALLVCYVVATTIGLAGLPWVMTGEVFPADLRGLGSGICTCMCFCAFFLVVKTAPAMFAGLGADGTFLAYGLVALLGTSTMYCFLPETKGRTLQDIEEGFRAERKLGGGATSTADCEKRDGEGEKESANHRRGDNELV